ncbi:hypothetical protein GDO81_002597 [Engystomops pustulosus]|uniref:Uncharacterized protein n=1 Tax=Engystomops pustulosus TaxID=76066 RepID=A0AAV7DQ87_ENGPU|nr:hypothetical protein GDO81_002597 [Engystomops pustulosus]
MLNLLLVKQILEAHSFGYGLLGLKTSHLIKFFLACVAIHECTTFWRLLHATPALILPWTVNHPYFNQRFEAIQDFKKNVISEMNTTI